MSNVDRSAGITNTRECQAPVEGSSKIVSQRSAKAAVALLVVVAMMLLAFAPAQAIAGPVKSGVGPLVPVLAQPLGKLTADDGAAGDSFGRSVSVSGDTAVIGVPNDSDAGPNSGSVYVFTRSGLYWHQQAKLTAADATANNLFGFAVSISGDTVIVGAHQDDDDGGFSGSVYIFTRSGAAWSQEAKLTAGDAAPGDKFGVSVAAGDDTVVVGAHSDDADWNNSGAAYVFSRSGTAWTQQAKLTAADAAQNDYLGLSVGLSGDTVVVGAHGDDDAGSDSGSAYVFTRSGTAWSQQAKLSAADAFAGNVLGYAVSVSGDTVVVGAPGPAFARGATYVFTRSGTIWSQQMKFLADDGSSGDSFGKSVAVSADSAVVGALGDDDDGGQSGSAYVFVRSGNDWSQHEKLTAEDAEAGDLFGGSVAISGITIGVGAYQNDDDGADSGSAYMFVDTDADSDGDGVSDFDEIEIGTDPLVAATSGYWMLEADGTVYEFGDSADYAPVALPGGARAVAFDRTAGGDGLWILDSLGRVNTRGTASHHGDVNVGALAPGDHVASISGTPTGLGYWVFTDQGQALAFGDADHFGDLPSMGILPNGLIVGSVATPSGGGYYMLGADGGLFAFGDAEYFGSIPSVLPSGALVCPIVGLVPALSGDGYWMVACDGGVFAFGNAPFRGSVPGVLAPGQQLNSPINGLVPYGNGYLMVAADGGAFTFSDIAFLGSLGGNPPDTGIVAIAAFAS